MFQRFVEVCLNGDSAATAQIDHVTSVERHESPESGVYVKVVVDRAEAEPILAPDEGPYTLRADDRDGPFVELLIWLDGGYLDSIEGWKQQTQERQVDEIVRLPDPSAFERADA